MDHHHPVSDATSPRIHNNKVSWSEEKHNDDENDDEHISMVTLWIEPKNRIRTQLTTRINLIL